MVGLSTGSRRRFRFILDRQSAGEVSQFLRAHRLVLCGHRCRGGSAICAAEKTFTQNALGGLVFAFTGQITFSSLFSLLYPLAYAVIISVSAYYRLKGTL